MNTRWPPYVLFPSEPERGRPFPEVLQVRPRCQGDDWFEALESRNVDIVHVWPLEFPVKNMLVSIAGLFVREEELKRVSDVDITNWLNMTRRLARDLPYGGPLAGEMLAAADRLQRIREGFTRHLKPAYKVVGMKREHQLRLNLNIYALDRLLRAAKAAEPAWAALRTPTSGGRRPEYLDFDLAGAWEHWLGPHGVTASATSDDAIRERIARVRKHILPNHEDAVLRDVLAEHLTFSYSPHR